MPEASKFDALEQELRSVYERALQGGLEREPQRASPYPGLRPFLAEESQFFRGRETQIREIGRRFADESCVAVLGGSGCGKSSIVRAGVIPALRRKLIPERGDLWRAAICTPGRTPLDNLVTALEKILRPDQALSTARQKNIREVLYGADGIGGFLPAFRNELDIDPELSEQALERTNVLILIDQFEELFRDENRRKPQVADLVGLVIDFWRRRDKYPGLYLALTMRTDDLHRCAEFINLPDLINATSYLTRRLREDELRDAIVAPVRPPLFRAGLLEGTLAPGQMDLRPYDVDIVTELLDATEEIAHDPDHLPLLQHLLAVLWRFALERWRREADKGDSIAQPQITRHDLATALGFNEWKDLVKERDRAYKHASHGWLLRRCLRHVANELYEGTRFGTPLTKHQREIARTGFCLMGEVDDRGNFKRRWTTEKDIASVAGLGKAGPDTQAFIHRYSRDHRLLWVRDSGEIDVSHEALMRNWPRLADWLKTDRDAGNAYKKLGERYENWKRSSQSRLPWWLCCIMQKSGYLGSESLEHIAPLLTRKRRKFTSLVPEYNGCWAQRFTASTGSGDIGQVAKDKDGRQDCLLDKEFMSRLRYLKQSMRRDSVRHALFHVAAIAIIIVLGYSAYQIDDERKRAEVAFRKATAAILWSELDGWDPVLPNDYVNSLWKVALATPSIRAEFVRQIPDGSHIKQMGFRPQPIIRSIGIVWPEEARKIVSDTIKKELSKKGSVTSWTLPSLACATAVLGDRLDKETRDHAIAQVNKFIKNRPNDVDSLWPKARVLACLGGELQPEETRTNALHDVFSSATEKAPSSQGFRLAKIASAGASTVWEFRKNDPMLELQREGLNEIIDAVFAGLEKTSRNDMPIYLSTRSLVSLIAALPTGDQHTALYKLISVVSVLPESIHPDIRLMLVQAFETMVRNHSEDKSAERKALVDHAEDLLSNLNADQAQAHINKITIARLAVPLLESGETQDKTKLYNMVVGLAGVENPATGETEYLLELPAEPSQIDGLLIGLKGRILAHIIAKESLTTSIDPGKMMEDMIKLLHRLGPKKPELLEASGNDVSMRPDPSESKRPDLSRASGNFSQAGNFAREGLAHAFATLALKAGINDDQRLAALQAAKGALANTGSAEEAAAWAAAIRNLLINEENAAFVAEMIEVLKYPTAALTAREPNASEPRNATDIFTEALVTRLDLSDVKPGPGYHRRVLKNITGQTKFSHIDPTKPPKDPRRSSVGDN